MVFIRKSAGRSGATKVQIAERRDGRNHIVEHVGTARSDPLTPTAETILNALNLNAQ